jgi:hypothetical protein
MWQYLYFFVLTHSGLKLCFQLIIYRHLTLTSNCSNINPEFFKLRCGIMGLKYTKL